MQFRCECSPRMDKTPGFYSQRGRRKKNSKEAKWYKESWEQKIWKGSRGAGDHSTQAWRMCLENETILKLWRAETLVNQERDLKSKGNF